MRVNQVVIIPSVGNSKTDFGRYFGRFCENDAVAAYVEPLCEFLDQDRIRFQAQSPAFVIEPNSLVVYCTVGWDKEPEKLKTNHSTVAYAQASSRKLGEFTLETVSEWGKCYVDLSHKAKEISNAKDKRLSQENVFAIEISPFCLNGPKVEDYIQRCEVFGKMMSQCIYEFMNAREEVPKLPATYK